jgi:predicted ATPase
VATTSEAAVIVEFNLAQPSIQASRHERAPPIRRPWPYQHEPAAIVATPSSLDQKYASLGEIPRRVLRRVAVFVGKFTLEAACSVASCAPLQRSAVSEGTAELLASSLLESDHGDSTGVRYLLSLPTRLFALGKLVCHGEQDLVARNHAQYLRCVLEYAEVEFDRREPDRWMAHYASLLGDVRAALDWAFSPSGDASIGVDLTVAAIPLFLLSELLSAPADELQRRIGRALKSEAATSHSGRHMRLRTAARLAGMSDF